METPCTPGATSLVPTLLIHTPLRAGTKIRDRVFSDLQTSLLNTNPRAVRMTRMPMTWLSLTGPGVSLGVLATLRYHQP